MLTTVCPLANSLKSHSKFNNRLTTVISSFTTTHITFAAVLRDISEGTSYQMVRLVFRHYAQLMSTSCTSVRLRSSNRLSSTFNQATHSSPSFGSDQHVHRNHPPKTTTPNSFESQHVHRLLGPCYKTGDTMYPSPFAFSFFVNRPFHISITLLLRYRSSHCI